MTGVPFTSFAVNLVHLLKEGDIFAVGPLDHYLSIISQFNPHINAVITLAEDRARKTALEADETVRRGDEPGLLHGLPIVVKDITETANIRTNYANLH